MVAERQRSESNAPSTGDTYMPPPPSYDDVKVNGASQQTSAESGPKTAKSLYFLAEVLLDNDSANRQSATCVEHRHDLDFRMLHVLRYQLHNVTMSGDSCINIMFDHVI